MLQHWQKLWKRFFFGGANYTNHCGSTLLFCQSYQSFKLATLGRTNYTNYSHLRHLVGAIIPIIVGQHFCFVNHINHLSLQRLRRTNYTNYSQLRNLVRAITPIIVSPYLPDSSRPIIKVQEVCLYQVYQVFLVVLL